MSMERKFLTFEFKAAQDGADLTFEGYGSVFDTVDSYNDTIQKGAFKQTLVDWKSKGKLPKMLLQHGGGGLFSSNADDMVPIGKWEQMKEDKEGLFVAGRLFNVDTDRAKSVTVAMREGELDGLSIGFRTKKWNYDEESDIRTLTEIELWEVSVVTFPANDPARISVVKADGTLPTEREFERWLQREVGFSKNQAEIIISKGYRRVLQGGALPSDEACGDQELLSLVKRRAAIFTGDGNGHGKPAANAG